MIRYLTIPFFLFVLHTAYAQEQWGWQVMDTTYLVCQYDYNYPGGIPPRIQKDDMRLEIGRQVSKFYSRITFEYDSLRTTVEGRAMISRKAGEILKKTQGRSAEEQAVILDNIPSRRTDCVVYKKYQDGIMYIQDAAGYDHYEYEEEGVLQSWSIEMDTATILGYHCQRATCAWRGRDYEAWFTTEIPISDGPMKFLGLPGLIVRISEGEGIYSFELKGIENLCKPIYLNVPFNESGSQYDYKSIDRGELLEKQMKYKNNIIRALKRDMIRLGKSTKDLKENMFSLMEKE